MAIGTQALDHEWSAGLRIRLVDEVASPSILGDLRRIEVSAGRPIRDIGRLLEEGRRCWRLWLEQLKGSIESNVWPGYAESIVEWDASELEIGESIGFDEDAA